MPLAFTKVRHDITSAGRMHVYDVTFQNPYTGGGEPVTPANFGLRSAIHSMDISFNGATAANGRGFSFEPTATGGKIHLWTAFATEASGDQSAVTARCTVYGDNISGR